jgi:hypothetical protein
MSTQWQLYTPVSFTDTPFLQIFLEVGSWLLLLQSKAKQL